VFFFASKIFWMIASPVSLLLFATLIGVLLGFSRCVRLGRGLALTAILILLAAAMLPVGMFLIAPLRTASLSRPWICLRRRALSCSVGQSMTR
jgi:hypothetical protein